MALLVDQQATPDVKQWAARALRNLSLARANRQPLVAAGVHTRLRRLLDDPQATPNAKESAAGALRNLEGGSCCTVS